MLKKLVGIFLALGFVAACSGGIRAGNPGPPPGRADGVVVAGRLVKGAALAEPAGGREVRLEGPETLVQTTGNDGRFHFEGVTDGTYVVSTWVTSPGGGSAAANYAVSITEVVVGGNPINLGDLALPGALAGRVSLVGSTDLLGTDVFIPGTSFLAKTDANGAYVLLGVQPGAYTVVASRYGFDTQKVDDVAVVSGEVTNVPEITLTKGNIAGVAPTLVAASPLQAEYKEIVTLIGSNFGALQGDGKVYIAGIEALAVGWSDTLVQAIVPGGIEPGQNNVHLVRSGLASNTAQLGVRPTVLSVPTMVSGNDELLVTGANLGAAPGTLQIIGPVSVVLGTHAWRSESVTAVVPSTLPVGVYTVSVVNELADQSGKNITVTARVLSVAPSQVTIATVVSIIGTNFGSAQGSGTLAVGGAAALVSSWTNERIECGISVDAQPGQRSLSLQLGGRQATAPVDIIPTISLVTSNFGSGGTTVTVGTGVTIRGANFGAAAGAIDLGGTNAPVYAWSSTEIVFHVPTGVFDGTQDLRVTTENQSATVTTRLLVDTQPPETFLSGTPSAITNSTFAMFTFSSTDNIGVDYVACRLDNGIWSECASPVSYASLSTGTHSFEVKAVDRSGLVQQTPTGWSWIIDRSPPDTVILDAPPIGTTETTIRFTFSGADNVGVARFECRLDREEWETCSSPREYFGLSTTAVHTFAVRAIDLAGNVEPTPSTWLWYSGDFVASKVALGTEFSCALARFGWLSCWGYNADGRLGDGTTLHSATPVDVLGFALDAIDVSAGWRHACAVTSSGAVKCWGNNEAGQLGDGTTCPYLVTEGGCNGNVGKSVPVYVIGLTSEIAQVAAGGDFSCALGISGTVSCWGSNYYGQLGDGTTTNRYSPVAVSGLSSGVVAISAGSGHACALLAGGSVKCWGRNSQGQLGDGTTTTKLYPVDVTGLSSNISAIDTGAYHTCALGEGNVFCWGHNEWGQLGDGTQTYQRSSPAAVTDLPTVSQISAGGFNSCALEVVGGVHCWGKNWHGALGNGTLDSFAATPTQVSSLGHDVTAVTVGENHSCSQTTGGKISCWGSNGYGALGNGWENPKSVATEVGGSWLDVAVETHACAIAFDGTLWCWGANFSGQVGVGDFVDRAVPMQASAVTSWTSLSVSQGNSSLAVRGDGTLWGWGSNSSKQLYESLGSIQAVPAKLGSVNDWRVASSGGYSTCALKQNDALFCWGGNFSGQLGLGHNNSPASGQVAPGSTWQSVSAGTGHTCAIQINGTLWCWGSGIAVGDGTGIQRESPVQVGVDNDWVQVATGHAYTCAIKTGGSLWCWGANNRGQLGDGTIVEKYSPVRVGTDADWSAVNAGYDHTCALKSDGSAWCWGANDRGQLGDGSLADKLQPVREISQGTWRQISAGNTSSCALGTSNRLWCWGSNSWGQIGDGTAWSTTPVGVVGF